MSMHPVLRWTLRAAVIPAAVIAYISIAGLTGFCPSCKQAVDGVLGRYEPMAKPSGAVESIEGLTAYTLEGEPVALTAAHAGKPMIIEFWATWCPPCREQRAIIDDMADELKDVSLASLSMDNDPRVVAAFLKQQPSKMTELMAPRELADALGGVESVPTLVFVDAKGRVRGVEAGVHSARKLRARLAELAAN